MVYCVRSGSLAGFTEFIAQQAANPIELLDLADILPAQLRDPDNMVLYSKVAELLELAALRINDPLLGLHLNRKHGLATVGLIGAYMAQQPTIHDALKTAKKFTFMHAQGALIELNVHSETVCELRLDMLVNNQRQYPQLVQMSVGLIHNIVRDLMPAHWHAEKVTFCQHGSEALQAECSRILHCPVVFNAQADTVFFSTKILNLKPSQPANLVNDIIERQFQQHQSSPEFDNIALVKHAINMLLPTGDCNKQNIAKSLAIHPKKLQRLLQQNHTSFRNLLEQTRREIAKRTLELNNMSLTNLALNLGYADFSAFSRAFKVWFGVSPTEFKTMKL